MAAWLLSALSSATISALLVMAAAWLARSWIGTRLKAAIEAEYSAQLETLKSRLRTTEDELKAVRADVSANSAAVRETSLAARSQRSAKLYERKLVAVDQLWGAVRMLRDAGGICAFVWSLKFDAAAQEAKRSENFRKVFDMFNYDPAELNKHDAAAAQPYVSPEAWKCFEAMRSLTMHGLTRWVVLKTGSLSDEIVSVSNVIETVSNMFPDLRDYMEKYKTAGFLQVVTELQTRLLNQLRADVSGHDEDHENVARAVAITADVDAKLQKFRDPLIGNIDASLFVQIPSTAPPSEKDL